ncbi:MAG: hypothetical protein WEE89_15355 [Gemmatimonadota bacterium]
MGFFDELKRRRVIRVVVAYGAVAFAIAQAATSFFPALHLPDWSVTLVVAICLLGFPVAAVLAWAFDITDQGIVRAEDAVQPLPRRPSKTRQAIAAVVILLCVGLGIALALNRSANDAAIDQNLIVVLPFRVSGDASLEYLREGMVDLLGPALAMEEGTRAVDPRSTMSTWRRLVKSADADLPPDSALEVARALGAGRVLLGSIVGTPTNVTLTAEIYGLPTGARRASGKTSGSADTLQALIDNLTAQLLSLDAGESQHRIANLTSTSLDAVKEYLIGQAHFRQARFVTAAQHFDRAVESDSTFALAALGLRLTSGWGAVQASNLGRAPRLVRNYQERLAPGDREFGLAMVGSTPQPRSVKQILDTWNRVVSLYPDRPDAWFQYADELIHRGQLAEVRDAAAQAKRGFQRALALDSSFTPALIHLIDHAAIGDQDPREFARLYALLQRQPISRDVAPYQHWLRIYMRGDTAELRQFRAALDTTPVFLTGAMALFVQLGVGTVEDGELAAASALRMASTPAERNLALGASHGLFMNTGRIDDAKRFLERGLREGDALTWHNQAILDGMFWEGDTLLAHSAAQRLSELLLPKTAKDVTNDDRSAACTLGQWQLRHRNEADYTRVLALLQAPQPSGIPRAADVLCVALLRALRSAALNLPDAAIALEQLDSLAREGYGGPITLRRANATIAQLREARGEARLAANAQRRAGTGPDSGEFLSVWKRERGRFALLEGDTAQAIKHWTDYLRLQAKAEGEARTRMEQVRQQLAAITGERKR